MKKAVFGLFFLAFAPAWAQEWRGYGEAYLNLNNDVPFWQRGNRYGSVPLSGASVAVLGRIERDYLPKDSTQWLDWGVGLEARADLGNTPRVNIIEGYAKLKVGFLEMRGGRFKEFIGLNDSTLSMGSFSYSGTALGIPKVELRIPEYWPKKTLFAIRGNYAHGWHGYIPIKSLPGENKSLYTYLHQKSLWIRMARPHWKLKIYGGVVDHAFWGDEYHLHTSFTMSKAQRYWSVISGKNWLDSKVGNHVGSFDARAEYNLPKYTLTVYRQFFYEVGALWHLANIADGLMGLSVENKSKDLAAFDWKKILLEVLYTKNQAGEPWSKPTPTGNENYLNHYLYKWGWSYRDQPLGTPMITARHDAREGHPYDETEFFVNNRLWAINVGANGKVSNLNSSIKLTYSKNFGTRYTEEEFRVRNQFSAYYEISKPLKSSYNISISSGLDLGGLLPISFGLIYAVRKEFL